MLSDVTPAESLQLDPLLNQRNLPHENTVAEHFHYISRISKCCHTHVSGRRLGHPRAIMRQILAVETWLCSFLYDCINLGHVLHGHT